LAESEPHTRSSGADRDATSRAPPHALTESPSVVRRSPATPFRCTIGTGRDRIGFVFQAFNRVASLTAAHNVELPLRFAECAERRLGTPPPYADPVD